MKSKILKTSILVISTLLFSACSLSSKKNQQNMNLNPGSNSSVPTKSIQKTEQSDMYKYAAIKTQNGEIVVRLYQKEAPNTVANFLKKADSGFYNNLIFHRVEPDFVVQGGDPQGNGTGGGDIKSEINSIPFKRGSLGLARGGIKEISNDSQFFICLTDENCTHLTNEYVNFGEVVSGMEFVDSIKVGDKILGATSTTK